MNLCHLTLSLTLTVPRVLPLCSPSGRSDWDRTVFQAEAWRNKYGGQQAKAEKPEAAAVVLLPTDREGKFCRAAAVDLTRGVLFLLTHTRLQ